VPTSDDQFGGADPQELYDIAPCGYLSSSPDGTIIGVNQTVIDWMGYSRKELLSSVRFQDLLTTPGRIFYETQYSPLLQLQSVVKAVAFDLVRRDNTTLPALINSARRKNAAGESVIHMAIFDATDRRNYERELLRGRNELEQQVSSRTIELAQEVSERKQAEESLRELTARLLQLRDEEQRRLARALHDSVGQLLAGMSMNQSAISREKEKLTARSQERLGENIEMVKQISAEIRTISHLLHPPLLDEVGLGSALSWYIEGINKRSAMTITLDISPDFGRLSPELETAIFRIAQECLTNVHRHGRCERATVRLSRSSDFLSLVIADEGAGMEASSVAAIKSGRSSGVGLRGLRERVRQLRGNFDITSSSKGTIIQVRLPAS
jgi:PAS domain S-box-containing protein